MFGRRSTGSRGSLPPLDDGDDILEAGEILNVDDPNFRNLNKGPTDEKKKKKAKKEVFYKAPDGTETLELPEDLSILSDLELNLLIERNASNGVKLSLEKLKRDVGRQEFEKKEEVYKDDIDFEVGSQDGEGY